MAAFDYSWDLLCAAARECGSRAIHYVRADANIVSFAPDSFDVVFNVAALHHVQCIDRLYRGLCEALNLSGVFVNFDYVGPHRNQYSRRHWRRITRVNRRLPAAVRKQPLRRAHLPTISLARQRKDVLRDTARLRAFQAEEDRREARAQSRGGLYSFADCLTMLRHRHELRLLRPPLGRPLWRRG